MPFSLLINCSPTVNVPISHVQGTSIQAMFLHLIQQVDASLMLRLHDEPGYRPFTLSPLGIYGESGQFQGYWLPHDYLIRADSACYLRVTLLDDELFPVFSRYFEAVPTPNFLLGETLFHVTEVLDTADTDNAWSRHQSYAELIDRALRCQRRRTLRLRFSTPTSFRQGNLDLPLPLPKLVFQSYKRRFETFYDVEFLPDFEQRVEYHVGIANLRYIQTAMISIKNVRSIGFTGNVTFLIHKQAPPELLFQINLLAEYAFFCGTGKKTVLGMGQTRVE
jgi:CRISPR-associated endoribonuclease Cas6